MKKLLITGLLLISGALFAQEKPFSIGIKAGVNFSNVDGNVEEIDFSTRTSYHIGALMEFKATDVLAIQPEVLYSVQGAKVESGQLGSDDLDVKYLNVPVMLKIYIIPDLINLEAGPQFGFMMSDNLSDLKKEKFDFALAGGVGVDIAGGLFAQARYVAGMTEFSKDADLKNSNIQISLGYKF